VLLGRATGGNGFVAAGIAGMEVSEMRATGDDAGAGGGGMAGIGLGRELGCASSGGGAAGGVIGSVARGLEGAIGANERRAAAAATSGWTWLFSTASGHASCAPRSRCRVTASV
jgi:hypothetical protein